MVRWIRDLDRVLRGQATSPAAVADGELPVPAGGLLALVAAMGVLHGLCMSAFTLGTGGPNAGRQTLACLVKVPAVFLLTLGVTFPSLYVFNAMLGSRLTLRSVLRLLAATLAVTLAVLASIGPIVAFFSVTTTSAAFMVLLNVAVGGVAGGLGTRFLLQTLHRMAAGVAGDPAPPPGGDRGPLAWSAEHALGRSVRALFRAWVLIFALVGTQMAWVLSPFIGHGSGPFVLVRPTGSNFF